MKRRKKRKRKKSITFPLELAPISIEMRKKEKVFWPFLHVLKSILRERSALIFIEMLLLMLLPLSFFLFFFLISLFSLFSALALLYTIISIPQYHLLHDVIW